MALTSLKVFFARFGGRDFPTAYNWFDNYGFNATYDKESQEYIDYSGDPIYKHSLIDVLHNFESPISFVTKSLIENYKSISDLTIVETGENSDAKNIMIGTDFWQNVIKLIEFIYENQSEWRNPASEDSTDGTAYSCYGDQVLRSGESIYDSVIGVYKKGTLTVSNSSDEKLKTRILKCSFIVTPSDTDKSDNYATSLGSAITITLYFNPDTFITTGSTANYAVYSYEDVNGLVDTNINDTTENVYDDTTKVSKTEFDSQIVSKLNDILKSGKYKRYIRFCPTGGVDGATYFINDAEVKQDENGIASLYNGDEKIDSSNMSEYGYNKPFYIFTSLDESQTLSVETQLKYVREYVSENLYNGDDKILERNLRYPNLFTESTVSIYPVITNKTSNSYKFALDGTTLNDFLNTIGLTNGMYEIYYVGTSVYSTSNSDYRNIPLIANEADDISATSSTPISSRFPTYRPIYSSSEDNSDIEAKAIVFHELSILALSILLGDQTVTSVLQDNDLKTISISKSNAVETYDLVNNNLNLKETDAGVDATTGQTVRHCVQFTYNNVTYKFYEVTE